LSRRILPGLSLLDEISQNHEGNTLMILLALMTRKGHMDALTPGRAPQAGWRGFAT
jgi:hypothetical protein